MIASPDNPNDDRDEILGEPLLISVQVVARILDVSTRTVWRQLSAGNLPLPIRFGGAVRWRYHDIRKWIDDGCPPISSQ